MQQHILIGLLGGLAALLSQRCLAVFHDGLRPIMPDFKEGKIDHRAMMMTAFALCFGLIIGFGIPISVGATILLIHAILLGTDLIGVISPRDTRYGSCIAFLMGSIYANALLFGLDSIVELFKQLPINFMDDLKLVGAPVIIAYSLFPSLVIGYQYGVKKGIFAAVLTLAIKLLILTYAQAVPMFGTVVKFNADGMAIMVAMVIMLTMAMLDKTPKTNNNMMLANLFAQRVQSIRRYWWLFGMTGGLIAACTSLGLIAGDPVSLSLLVQGQFLEAGITALAVAIGFLSLVGTTAITTGLYSPAGMKFVFVVGIFTSLGLVGSRFSAFTPMIAFVGGFCVIAAEVLLLTQLAMFLDRFPGVKACGEHIRSATTRVLEVALLIGGAMAAQSIAPQLGFFWVMGLYLLNKTSKKPLVEMAVGPIAALSLGIIVNMLYMIGLVAR